MKRSASMLLLALPLTLALPFATGCNTALISQAAVIDAGPPCESITASVSCDAGGPATPGACPGQVPVVLDVPDASNTVPPGSFALGCTVSFFYQDPASAECNRAPACTCVTPDGGAAEDGGDSGVPNVPGVWSCIPTQ